MDADNPNPVAKNFKPISRLDIPGGGQVTVVGDYAYIAHMDPPHGTSIVDVSDPRHPKVVSTISLESGKSHSHKARVVQDDIMIVNSERLRRGFFRRAHQAADARAHLTTTLKREPTDAEIAHEIGTDPVEIPTLAEAAGEPYDEAGFRVFDISDRAKPRQIAFHKTGGEGAHRFDVDDTYAYISTGMDGFAGNILVNYDITDPARPEEVSRWWIPGQNLAGGETPSWSGARNQLHHAMRLGDELWAGCWYGGFAAIDISDIRNPKTLGSFDTHPTFKPPTHTAMKVPFPVAGRDIALVMDEEVERFPGQAPAFLWIFDVSDLDDFKPLSTFHVSEADCPLSRAGRRFGAHQYQEHIDDTVIFATWFSGGLRVIDFSDPTLPQETGHFIPEPASGQPNAQTNDVEVAADGLVYILDRFQGLDIVEYTP